MRKDQRNERFRAKKKGGKEPETVRMSICDEDLPNTAPIPAETPIFSGSPGDVDRRNEGRGLVEGSRNYSRTQTLSKKTSSRNTTSLHKRSKKQHTAETSQHTAESKGNM